jgi:4'-phosphopantetheinyl transferase
VIAMLYANTAEPWPLREGTVHVWRFACRQPIGDHAAVLSETERAQAARFLAPAHRDAYIVQHAMLRLLLARYTGTPPGALELGCGPRGKPFLIDDRGTPVGSAVEGRRGSIDGAGLELNLSHAEDVALLAVARGTAVGVDVERVDRKLDPAALRRIVCAHDEVFADRRGFLRIWCRKEACLKATGVGLIDDLTSVSVVADRVDVRGQIVHVRDLDLGTSHAAALATTVPSAAVLPAELERFSAPTGR